MNADRLLEHFERISDAADAVPRLRKFVLDLAVRGKLLPQDPSEALSTPGATGQDLPFAIPSAWTAIPLGDALHMINGRAFKPTDWLPKGLPIVRIQNLNNATAPFNFCNPDTVDDRHLIDDEEFLISWSGTPGTSFGAFIWRRGRAALNQHIFKCLPTTKLYTDRFLQMAINGRLDEMIAKAHGGVGLQHITKGKLESLVLPVPPLAEQHRIVAKVDELMALCDRLEAAQAEREARRDRLVSASLARVTEPGGDDATSRTTSARFHLDHFARLTTRPEHVKPLRQTILNLAVRGRLVPQHSSDGDGYSLLGSIKKSREQAVGTRSPTRRRRGEDSPGHQSRADDQTEVYCDESLPESWAIACVKELLIEPTRNGISVKGSDNPPGTRALRLNALADWGIDYSQHRFIKLPESVEAELAVVTGDFLVARGNGSLRLVGRAALATTPPFRVVFPDTAIRLRLFPDDHLKAYIDRVWRSEIVRIQIEAKARTTAGIWKVSQGDIEELIIPLPPLAEQRRIVAKVDELMALCDQLEASLASAATDRARLLEALIHEALTPAA